MDFASCSGDNFIVRYRAIAEVITGLLGVLGEHRRRPNLSIDARGKAPKKIQIQDPIWQVGGNGPAREELSEPEP